MNLVIGRPPMFELIDAAFHVAGKPVIFAWGDTIYNPTATLVTPEPRAHEAVHGRRQRDQGGPEAWWQRYIMSPQFRLEEEIPAHQAEYVEARRNNERRDQARTRNRLALHHIAKRLSSPLYGRLISYDDARRLIKQAA